MRGHDSHVTALLYEGGPAFTDFPGLHQWSAADVDTIDEPNADLRSIQPSFPQGKPPGVAKFMSVYHKMSANDGAPQGPWNQEREREFIDTPTPVVDGGEGQATVSVPADGADVLRGMPARTAFGTSSDPTTGADVGVGKAMKLFLVASAELQAASAF